MVLQVSIPVEILIAANETEAAASVHSDAATQEALRLCATAALSPLQAGWPGNSPGVLSQLRSRGAVGADSEAAASVEVTLRSNAEVVADVCPTPDVNAVASATANEVFSDIAMFLEHEVTPTLVQLGMLDTTVQVCPCFTS